ncbi:HAD family hydrolase [Prescottella agglutinans]|uniref:HAD family hydrolase n=1 Tax=Prescottella agglutinans TaxID=1644129 RepID=A0A3S3AXZ0_9NOCA|nr:HAD hydrolase-like protein [Prescottella agglutinans]RVW11190.1 HAD family hydrolase [Prescottella agglutinans]
MSTPTAAQTMVLFDWNGTVVCDADRARDALNDVLASYDAPPVTEDEFPTTFRLPMAEMFASLGLPSEHGPDAESRWNTAMTRRTTTLRPGARDALVALADSGTWLGVVSAASAEAVAFDINTLNVPTLWDTVVAPAADKASVLRSLRHHGDRAFYVGDTAYDMACATEAGYIPIGVRGGYAGEATLRAAGAHTVIDSLDELTAFAATGKGTLDDLAI